MIKTPAQELATTMMAMSVPFPMPDFFSGSGSTCVAELALALGASTVDVLVTLTMLSPIVVCTTERAWDRVV